MTAGEGGAPGTSRPDPWRVALVLWIGGALVMCWLFYGIIRDERLADPDDLMRLQEVRDFLAGQSWFDVTQYRLNPPAGAAMHWSRLLDVPLAAVILAVTPLAGQPLAERVALVLVPLATYGVILVLVLHLADRLAGRVAAVIAGCLCALDPGTLLTVRPMRIDHHGWQVACGVAMACAIVGRRGARAAALAGLAAALWAHVSLEALPFTAAAGGLIAWRWSFAPSAERAAEGARLSAYLAALAAGSLALFLVAHGGALFDRTFCDAVSPIHLGLFAVAAAGSGLLVRRPPAALWARWAGLAAIGAACLILYRAQAPQCAGGPFAGLDPLLYRLWYRKILEGLPIWLQPAGSVALVLGYPLIGLAGGLLAWRQAPAGEARRRWEDATVLLLAATAIGAMLMRAGSLANVLALPGGVALLIAAFARTRRQRSLALRVVCPAVVVVVLLPPMPMLAIGVADQMRRGPASARARPIDEAVDRCIATANLARLDGLPPTRIMSPLDIAPAVLVASRHSLIASGHHRNATAMLDVVRFFTGPEDRARAIAAAHGARFVLICPGEGEMRSYAATAPRGLAARLGAGDAPAWLVPVRVAGLKEARLWRVIG